METCEEGRTYRNNESGMGRFDSPAVILGTAKKTGRDFFAGPSLRSALFRATRAEAYSYPPAEVLCPPVACSCQMVEAWLYLPEEEASRPAVAWSFLNLSTLLLKALR